ncbi:MAG: uridine kinase [Bacteriovoracaceae bacterium]|nr:uridine kinase [Bacteriovoracaceae bacterium]
MRVIDSIKLNRSLIIGVAGGSGSGKTFFADALHKALGSEISTIVYQDNFYIDQSAKFDHDGGSVNFDHPDSLDFPLLAEKLKELKSGHATAVPIYDFATHKRRLETLHVAPRKVIIVDGILIFHPPYLRELFDEMIFFDTPEDLRFERRLKRDVEERGRTPEGVKAQFLRQVKPMHDQFVEPSKSFAGTVVCDRGDYDLALKDFFEKFKK